MRGEPAALSRGQVFANDIHLADRRAAERSARLTVWFSAAVISPAGGLVNAEPPLETSAMTR
jgi:hypothetical protein